MPNPSTPKKRRILGVITLLISIFFFLDAFYIFFIDPEAEDLFFTVAVKVLSGVIWVLFSLALLGNGQRSTHLSKSLYGVVAGMMMLSVAFAILVYIFISSATILPT
ncbi:hypothetical protein [Brevibacillus dissolubilis]|uniref:hypothetical protein n=1 Tax=Brevibacillus dissolubilis TaxID=1844116 RepID=UPI0011167D12|nr:hypothetical protein [Brevibacillus dissolubilis]